MEKHKKQNRTNWHGKQVISIPSKLSGTLFILICILLVILQIVTQWSCMDTLLPICIPWMYYQYVVLGVFLLSFIVNPIRRHFRNSLHRKNTISDSYEWKLVLVLIIVPAIIFLPNRYIPIEHGKIYKGKIINQTSAPVNKSSSSNRNYIKIKIDQVDTSFWYCLNKKTKPIGSKCVVSVRRGIFGMRYVEDVDFIVE